MAALAAPFVMDDLVPGEGQAGDGRAIGAGRNGVALQGQVLTPGQQFSGGITLLHIVMPSPNYNGQHHLADILTIAVLHNFRTAPAFRGQKF